MKVKAKFYVEITGWVTIEREVDSFDEAKVDVPRSDEGLLLDAMADEAVSRADEFLDGEVTDQEIEVLP